MRILLFVARRLLASLVVVFGISVVAFFLVHLVPGNPVRALLGPLATARTVNYYDHLWGLDRPLPVQYWLYFDRLLHGNLGTSLVYQTGVTGLIGGSIVVTLWLLGCTLVFSLLITVPLATIAAAYKGRLGDHFVRAASLIGLGVPSFWLGIMLLIVMSAQLHLFPAGGFGTGLLGHLHAIVLPGLTLAFATSPILIRGLRAGMLEVLEAEYVVTAHAKGLAGWRIWLHHVLRNAQLPALTLLGLNMGFMIGGTVAVESVFALPGVGRLLYESLSSRDFPVIQGLTLFFAVGVVIINLLTDIAYAIADPRVRLPA